ncbi:hypothetical protein [Ornithinimicrobium kibberense]|uniref:hypothetical protein n=1 Tax=Ornithinimicrobium kibberense TaxID=282060 RepID=UPI00361D3B01
MRRSTLPRRPAAAGRSSTRRRTSPASPSRRPDRGCRTWSARPRRNRSSAGWRRPRPTGWAGRRQWSDEPWSSWPT